MLQTIRLLILSNFDLIKHIASDINIFLLDIACSIIILNRLCNGT